MAKLTPLQQRALMALGIDNGVRTSFNVYNLRYKGELNKVDVFVADDVDQGVNPLIDVEETNLYLSSLLTANGTRISTYSEPGMPLRSTIDSGARTATSQGRFDFSTVTIDGSFTTSGMVVAGSYDNAPGAVAAEPTPDRMLNFSMTPEDLVQFIAPHPWPDNEYSIVGQTDVVNWPLGWLSWPDMSVSDDRAVILLRRLRCQENDFIRTIPLRCFKGDDPVLIPFVPGTRRFFLVVPVANNDITTGTCRVICGYLLGEGDDIFYSKFCNREPGVTNWNEMWGSLPRYPIYTNATLGYSSSFNTLTIYPLCGSPNFLDKVEGEFVFGPTEEEMVGNVNVRVTDIHVNVTSAYGRINTSDFREYLLTGYDLFTPLPLESADKILETWIKTNGGVSYKLVSEPCAGRSLKETSYYQDYGRARAKACKNNDFMDLRYNDEYTNKQVENKLQSLISKSVWIQSENTLASVGNVNLEQKEVVVIAEENSNQFRATAGGQTRIFAKTEGGVEAFFSAHAGYQINDPTNILGQLMSLDASGGDLAAYQSAISEPIEPSKYDLRFGDFKFGYAVSYSDVVAKLTITQQVAFLAAQVTDFVKFEPFIARLLNDFDFDKVFVKLIPSLEKREV